MQGLRIHQGLCALQQLCVQRAQARFDILAIACAKDGCLVLPIRREALVQRLGMLAEAHGDALACGLARMKAEAPGYLLHGPGTQLAVVQHRNALAFVQARIRSISACSTRMRWSSMETKGWLLLPQQNTGLAPASDGSPDMCRPACLWCEARISTGSRTSIRLGTSG